MTSGSVSEVWRVNLFFPRLSSIGMGWRFKYGLPQSTGNGLSNQS